MLFQFDTSSGSGALRMSSDADFCFVQENDFRFGSRPLDEMRLIGAL
jgi:hypothetical protein